ncbi:hypothetical protein WOLCODRAFT_119817 [Wolfiporia cocos MD-104 SS10]|uniref:Uncharacterized protein n=1 Tax=Wolfiporia cocos (strain MD-104) TaxID=742152 RepID=A0A2H3JJI2_WOLCO|nr:hypothetical protein WOLCODRAFT_119817 [Wolfiporia cocos MD-104 SS10]
MARSAVISRDSDSQSVTVALVINGYLGTTPISPSLAISLRSLELLYTIRLFKASFSIESFGKLMCHLYKVPFKQRFRALVADMFEIYLIIRRNVDKQVLAALG